MEKKIKKSSRVTLLLSNNKLLARTSQLIEVLEPETGKSLKAFSAEGSKFEQYGLLSKNKFIFTYCEDIEEKDVLLLDLENLVLEKIFESKKNISSILIDKKNHTLTFHCVELSKTYEIKNEWLLHYTIQGELLWDRPINNLAVTKTINDENLFLGSREGLLTILKLQTGEVILQKTIVPSKRIKNITFYSDLIYLTSKNEGLSILKKNSLNEIGRFKEGEYYQNNNTTIYDNRLYLFSDGVIHCLTLDAKELIFRADCSIPDSSNNIQVPPCFLGDYIFVRCSNCYLWVFHNQTGELVDKIEFPDYLPKTPITDGERLYFGGDDGYVYCYEDLFQFGTNPAILTSINSENSYDSNSLPKSFPIAEKPRVFEFESKITLCDYQAETNRILLADGTSQMSFKKFYLIDKEVLHTIDVPIPKVQSPILLGDYIYCVSGDGTTNNRRLNRISLTHGNFEELMEVGKERAPLCQSDFHDLLFVHYEPFGGISHVKLWKSTRLPNGKHLSFVVKFEEETIQYLGILNDHFETEKVLNSPTADYGISFPTLSPDGKKMAYAMSGYEISPKIFIHEASTYDLMTEAEIPEVEYFHPLGIQWCSDNRHLLFHKHLQKNNLQFLLYDSETKEVMDQEIFAHFSPHFLSKKDEVIHLTSYQTLSISPLTFPPC